MRTCPHCRTDNLTVTEHDTNCWTESCTHCGYEGGGTAYFVPLDDDSARLVKGTFTLQSVDRFVHLRQIVPEIASLPATEVIHSLRANGLTWTIESLPYHRAVRLAEACASLGIEFVISSDPTDQA